MPKVMLHEENAFHRLESPYRPTAGCQAMSCHDGSKVRWSVDLQKIMAFYVNLGYTSDV